MRIDPLLAHLKKHKLLQPTYASPYDPPKLENPIWSEEYERVQVDVEEIFQRKDEISEGAYLSDQSENLVSDNVRILLSDEQECYEQQRPSNCEILDTDAWYCPFHFFEEDFGIYIKEDALIKHARVLWLSLKKIDRIKVLQQRPNICWSFERQLIKASFFRLFFHELYHHRVECFATRLEMSSGRRYFAQYHELVYQKYSKPLHDFLIEEALASAYPLGEINARKASLFPQLKGCPNVGDILLSSELLRIKRSKTLGYRGAKKLVRGPFGKEKSALYSKSIGLHIRNFKELEWKLQQTIKEGFFPPTGNATNWEFAPDMMRPFFNASQITYKLIPRTKYFRYMPHDSGEIEYLSIKPRKALRKARDWGINRKGSGRGDHAKIELPNGSTRDFDMGCESIPRLEWQHLIDGMNMKLPPKEKYKNNQEGRRRFMKGP